MLVEVIRMLRMKDIVQLFGVSRMTVYKWMQEGMPHIRIGSLLFFEKEKVLQWVRSHGV